MSDVSNSPEVADFRLKVYRAALKVIFVAVVVALVKFCLIDTVSIRTAQMEPALFSGDRLIMIRIPHVPPISLLRLPAIGSVVVFKQQIQNVPGFGCLRVSGVSGDTIAITAGRLSRNGQENKISGLISTDEPVPAEYSPRDFMAPYRIPSVGDTILFDNLALHEFFFTAALYNQHFPRKSLRVVPSLFIDGQLSKGYRVANFPLHTGALDSVPADHMLDWFFWDRLSQHLIYTFEDKLVDLTFALYSDNTRLIQFVVTKPSAFLIAEAWHAAYDSRFFGPVVCDRIRGSAAAVLWSVSDSTGGVRFDRVLKIVK